MPISIESVLNGSEMSYDIKEPRVSRKKIIKERKKFVRK